MQFFFSPLLAALLPAPAFAQDDTWSARVQATLERGGLTSFLGDGRLRDGRDRMAEIRYSAALDQDVSLTADAQRVVNSGYDMDRGPAAFLALRLHRES